MACGGYFDNSATTKPCAAAIARMEEMLTGVWGNPSSLYDMGIAAEAVLEEARRAIAARVGARAEEVYFTSGGTEANNLALLGAAAALRRRGKRVILSAVEHASVLEAAAELERQGFEVIRLTPAADGRIPPEKIAAAVNGDTILLSMMLVNNETGAINPVGEAARLLKAASPTALLHCDCVQAFGKLPFKMEQLGADVITLSAHKIHGPKGVGALVKRREVRLLPRVFGGEQERKLRPGTEASPLIAGLLGAMEALPDPKEAAAHAALLQKSVLEGLRGLPGIEVNSPADGLPYILNLSVTGIRSETMLHFLEERGLYVSSGSACSKGKGSHVLAAMGLSRERVDSAVRISFSRENTVEECAALAEGIRAASARLKRNPGNRAALGSHGNPVGGTRLPPR